MPNPARPRIETIRQFLELYGDRWQLTQHRELAVYMALSRPTPTSERVIVARTIAELAAKVAAAEAPEERSEIIRHDIGGWISGPSISSSISPNPRRRAL